MGETVAELSEALESVADRMVERARGRLRSATGLSENERYVLSTLGMPHEHTEALLDIGAQALRLAQDLSGTDWEETYVMQDALDPAEPYCGIPRDGLELEAARQAIRSLPEVVSRSQEVVWQALNEQPPPRVSAYMRRLGRCYVAGFDAEVVILCRAVLDSALMDQVDDTPSAPRSMYERINALRTAGVLSDAQAKIANEIRHRGNRAVHEEPAGERIASDTLSKTMALLMQLFEEE